MESAQAQKAGLEENIRIMKASNAALEEKVRQSGAELAKASEFVQRLQSEFKATKAKLKIKMAVVVQQDKVYCNGCFADVVQVHTAQHKG